MNLIRSVLVAARRLVDQDATRPLIDEEETRRDVSRQRLTSGNLSLESVSKQMDDDDEPDERGWCAICREGFKKKPEADLVCGHSYHESCLIDHFQATRPLESECICFLCKQPLRFKSGALLYDMLPYRELLFRNRIRLGHRSTGRVPFDFERPQGILNELPRF